jgi:hexosaminidase
MIFLECWPYRSSLGTSNPEKIADFQNRMMQHFDFLTKKGINYKSILKLLQSKTFSTGNELFELKSATNSSRFDTQLMVQLNSSSIQYSNPIEITKGQTIKLHYLKTKTKKVQQLNSDFFG